MGEVISADEVKASSDPGEDEAKESEDEKKDSTAEDKAPEAVSPNRTRGSQHRRGAWPSGGIVIQTPRPSR